MIEALGAGLVQSRPERAVARTTSAPARFQASPGAVNDAGFFNNAPWRSRSASCGLCRRGGFRRAGGRGCCCVGQYVAGQSGGQKIKCLTTMHLVIADVHDARRRVGAHIPTTLVGIISYPPSRTSALHIGQEARYILLRLVADCSRDARISN